MPETVLLRATANVRNVSPNATAGQPSAQLSGAHPIVQVNMNQRGVQQPGGKQVKQGVVILPPKTGTRNFTPSSLPNQRERNSVVVFDKEPSGASAPLPPLTADQLLLCRHLADKYLGEQRAGGTSGEAQADGTVPDGAASVSEDNAKLAEATISAIDAAMAQMTAAAALAAAAPTVTTATATAPSAPVPPRRNISAGPRSAQNLTVAPRRIARPASPPPPPVAVKMNDLGQPVLHDPAEAASQASPAEASAQD